MRRGRKMEARSDRLNHMPIPVTKKDLESVDTCPCCKVGQIEARMGRSFSMCSVCKQRYRVEDEG